MTLRQNLTFCLHSPIVTWRQPINDQWMLQCSCCCYCWYDSIISHIISASFFLNRSALQTKITVLQRS